MSSLVEEALIEGNTEKARLIINTTYLENLCDIMVLTIKYKYIEILRLLLETQEFTSIDNYSIYITVIEDSIEILKLLLDHPLSNVRNINVAIETASKYGRTEIVRFILKNFDIKFDNEAIIIASSHGYTEIVRLLLEDGRIDPCLIDENDKTAIGEACLNGHIEIVKLLIENCNINNHQLVYLASSRGHIEIVRLFLDKTQIDLTINNNRLLLIVYDNGYYDILILFIKHLKRCPIDIDKEMILEYYYDQLGLESIESYFNNSNLDELERLTFEVVYNNLYNEYIRLKNILI
jgi:ankyrin repeat protein